MPVSNAAEPVTVKPSSWHALKSGEAVALMRHALAPGFGDPSDFVIGDCTTQRNLSDEGRVQATAIGDMLRHNGITTMSVRSSEWCRCIDTAEHLNFGAPVLDPRLNSFFQKRDAADDQTAQVKRAIQQWLSKPDGARILVTHQVNISALTGFSVGSGDIYIVGVENNDIVVLDTIAAPVFP